MSPNALMKANIDAFLRARGLNRRGLARYVLRTHDERADTWISKIMKAENENREFGMEYWPRICEYLGVSVYQLFQPGFSVETERRKTSRRSGRDRRKLSVSADVARVPAAVDIVDILNVLERERRERILGQAIDELRQQMRLLKQKQTPEGADDATHRTGDTRSIDRARKTKRGR